MSLPGRLYYSEPGLFETVAVFRDSVVAGPRQALVFESTVFFPEGGGQPSDLGFLEYADSEKGTLSAEVIDVRESEGRVLHYVSAPVTLAKGQIVRMAIDPRRRRYHTQQHSGQHLLSAVLEREYGIHTVGFHLGRDSCTIDVTATEIPSGRLVEVEAACEERIAARLPLLTHICPPEDPRSFPLRKSPPEGETELRIVELQGYDWVPCCGTHVTSCADIRLVHILGTEKYKGKLRVHFVSGDAAVALAVGRSRALAACSARLGVGPEGTEARIQALLEKVDALDSGSQALVRELAIADVERALGDSGITDRQVLLFDRPGWDVERSQAAAKAGTDRGSAVVACSDPGNLVVVMRPKSGAFEGGSPLSSLLAPLLALSGGRGGGGPDSFRGSFPDPTSAREFAAAAARAIASDVSGGLGS